MINMSIKIILSAILMVLFASPVIADVGDWQNFTFSDDATDIAAGANTIWCSTAGGLIRFDIDTGQTRKYLNSDGLAAIDLLSVTVDTSGAVFTGGSNGALTKIESDGEIKVYNFEYITEIRYNLWDLYVDGEILWVATDIGIGKFLIHRNDGEFRDVIPQLGDFPRETSVNALVISGDYLWAGTDLGLAYIDKNNDNPQNPLFWSNISEGENGLTNGEVVGLATIADTIFAGTDDGVFMMNQDSSWQNIGFTGSRIYSLENVSGGLAAGTSAGVYIRSDSGWELLANDSLLTDDCRGICQDSLGNTWAAFMDGGFAVYNDTYWEVVSLEGPASNYISDIAIDSSGHLWLTHAVPGFTSVEGVSRYDGSNWFNYTPQNSELENSGAVSIDYDYRNDLIWFGSWGNGLKSFDRESDWVTYDETNSPLAGVSSTAPYYVPVTDVAIDDDGNIWVLEITANNPAVTFAVFDPVDSIWQAYYEDPAQIPDHFQRVLQLRGNDVFFGGTNVHRLNFGSSPFDTTDNIWFDPIVSTSGGEVFALGLDFNSKLFIGGAWGLAYYDLEFDFPTNDTVTIELPDGYRTAVNTIAVDGLGYNWIGTDSGVVVLNIPLNQYQSNVIDTFNTSNSGLISNNIKHIEIDQRTGIVYIGTSQGLSLYSSGNVASDNLDNLKVWPNPVNIRRGDDFLNFLGIPAEAVIYIYNAAGELIISGEFSDRSWDLTTQDGNLIAAGVYFFYVRSGDKSGTGKFAVIR